MERNWHAGVVLAALEQIPGEPADLTALLRDPEESFALLGPEPELKATESAATVTHTDLEPRSDLGRYLRESLDHGRIERWTKIIDRGVQDGRFRPLVVGWPDYPGRLDHTWDAPPILFRALGGYHTAETTPDVVPTDDLNQIALAIVGGRQTSSEVLRSTTEVAEDLAARGVRVVSGLAVGVDTAAHEGALNAGGITTAVLGTGIDNVYPTQNRQLAHQISRYGVLLSQFAPAAPRTGTTFLRRNSVIAALSDASLIMDGQARSGSRHEIEQAMRYGKPVYMWRPALGDADWAQWLAEVGTASFVDSALDVLEHLK